MVKKYIAYGFFKPDAIEDKKINEIISFVKEKGFLISLIKTYRFTPADIFNIYDKTWEQCNSDERKKQLLSNLANLIRSESYIFKLQSVCKNYKNVYGLYEDLDRLKGKAYDNPPVTIRSKFKTPFVKNMAKEEELFRISRNRIHVPSGKEEVKSMLSVFRKNKLI